VKKIRRIESIILPVSIPVEFAVFNIDSSLEVFLTESRECSVLRAIAMGSNPAVKKAINEEKRMNTMGISITE